jgi:gluconolactonase
LKEGRLSLVSNNLSGPNGLAFSPDERFLYVGNWDERNKVVMRYEIDKSGAPRGETVFFDPTSADGADAIDGVKVDERGNVYVSGPGGLWIVSPEGKRLGQIVPPEHPHNLAWGGADRKSLYLTAQTGLYRLRLNVAGAR